MIRLNNRYKFHSKRYFIYAKKWQFFARLWWYHYDKLWSIWRLTMNMTSHAYVVAWTSRLLRHSTAILKVTFSFFVLPLKKKRRELSIPQVEPAFLGGPTMFDTCSMYDVDYEDVIRNNLRPDASWKTKSCTDGWEYDYEQTRYSTIVSEVRLINYSFFLIGFWFP